MNGTALGGREGVKALARASVSEDRLMWVSERNSRLFDSQLSDRPGGLAVQRRQQSPSHVGLCLGLWAEI